MQIAGVAIDAISFGEAADAIVRRAQSEGEPVFVVTPNAHHLVTLQHDAVFRTAYGNAFLCVADGVPLLWAARILHERLPERVNGTDLLEELCARAAQEGLRVFFLGGREGAAAAAAACLRKRYATLDVCGLYCPPLGFEHDASERDKVCAAIREAAPHLLFVGLGAPKQEYWMDRNVRALGVPVSLGIGVSFELVSGMVRRAPQWMQKCGLEWFFRLLVEPRRLWRRYLVTNAVFCQLIARERLARR